MLSRNLLTSCLAKFSREINREVVVRVYTVAKKGAANNVATAGIFDLDVDSNGRWSVEKFKGLLFQIERDCNAIAQETRRGKGNFLICSADVASALAMAGVLDYSSGLTGAGGPAIGTVDDTGNLAVGTINGRIKVYVDPYAANLSDKHYYVVGYKGPPLMMQVYSTAHMYPSRWSARSILTPSNQKLVSRLVTAWSATHSSPPTVHTTAPQMAKHSPQMQTCTTEEYKLPTSCDSRYRGFWRGLTTPLFLSK